MEETDGIGLWKCAERCHNNVQRVVSLLQRLNISLQCTFSAMVAVLVVEAFRSIHSNTC